MRKHFVKAVRHVNIAKVLCDHLIGEEHSARHRMGAGVVIMSVGVVLAQASHSIPLIVLSYAVDGVGYLIHGIGAIPFAEAVIQARAKREE